MLSLTRDHLKKLILFDGLEYGFVVFQLYLNAQWQPVIVDTRIPCINKKPVFGTNISKNEFWVALIEKAMAKIKGSYERLNGGYTDEAMVDLTGGVTEKFNLR